jgi:glycosyltransferase involved in cell wall biosynthesis
MRDTLKQPLINMQKFPKISIALCTHNGDRFLKEQLQSLENQSVPANEIIICDDDSTDNTLQIIQEFSAKLPIKFFQNKPALRTIKNFEYAISLCTGDIIFPCDQDDFWMPQKLEKMVQYLEENSDKEVVCSNARMVDEQLNDLGASLWDKVRLWEKQILDWENGKAFELLLQGNRVTGCTLAMRHDFAKRAIPFPTDIHSDFIHDGWIGILGALNNRIGLLNEALVLYRQHENQQVGIIQRNTEKVEFSSRFSRPRNQKIAPLLAKSTFYNNLLNYLHNNYPELRAYSQSLQTIAEHYKVRSSLSEKRLNRLNPIVRNFIKGNYHRYQDLESRWYGKYLAILGDLLE